MAYVPVALDLATEREQPGLAEEVLGVRMDTNDALFGSKYDMQYGVTALEQFLDEQSLSGLTKQELQDLPEELKVLEQVIQGTFTEGDMGFSKADKLVEMLGAASEPVKNNLLAFAADSGLDVDEVASLIEDSANLNLAPEINGFRYASELSLDNKAPSLLIEQVANNEILLDELSPEQIVQLDEELALITQVQETLDIGQLDGPEAMTAYEAAMQDPAAIYNLDRAGLYQISLKLGNMPSMGAMAGNLRSWTISNGRDGATALQSEVASNFTARQSAGGRVDLLNKSGATATPDSMAKMVMTPDDITKTMTEGPLPSMSMAS